MKNEPLQQEISYKDPAGFVVKLADGFYRFIAHSYKAEFEHLVNSGLYTVLADEGLMIPHEEVPLNDEFSPYYKKIFPKQIDLISYPFEWTYGQWRQMILTYIGINQKALRFGMILKDASPYNFTFYNNQCVLLDTLSFSFYNDGASWLAYSQFCEEILSPFLLMHYNDPMWAKLSRANVNGLPLAFVSRQLPFATRFNMLCSVHIHLHARFQQVKRKGNSSKSGFTKEKLQLLFKHIKSNISKKKQPLLDNSIWQAYYENDIESDAYLNDKENIISAWLEQIKPRTTVDIGANNGKFSFIASAFSERVYALESDIYCVEDIYKKSALLKNNNITTIVADIADPSPGLGWGNKEKTSLLQRVKGDLLMALALIHHLCLSRNIPLPFIAKLFADITTRYTIVEFVPKTDAKSVLLLQNKGDMFDQYTEVNFIKAFQKYFKLLNTHVCSNSGRKMFLWEKA